MKYLLTLLLSISLTSFSAKAQYVTIPDAGFRSYLMDWFGNCLNASNQLDTTCSAVVNAVQIDIDVSVSNWYGFQFFKNLQSVTFENPHSALPALPNTLKELIVNEGQITALPTLPSGLTRLTCFHQFNLITLPPLPNGLVYLDCSENSGLLPISSLPASLKYLNCNESPRFSTLPALPASLDTLLCNHDSLTVLPSLPSSLKQLDCNANFLTLIPALPAQLKWFDCGANGNLSTIPTLPSQLQTLRAGNLSLMTSLPALPATLVTLWVSGSNLSSLPTLPASLQELYCGSNNLTTIPTLPAGLLQFACDLNHISTLPAIPTSVTFLSCTFNNLAVLPTLPAALSTFHCDNNHITSMPTLPAGVVMFSCAHNLLTTLPAIPSGMEEYDCSYNQLTELPALSNCNALEFLTCHSNNISCMPVLPNSQDVTIMIEMDDKINCVPNRPDHYSIQAWEPTLTTYTDYADNANNYPFCSAVNNMNHCDAFPLMTGHVYYDNNNNLVHDANEPYKANAKIQLSNGTIAFTNSNGYYEIPADNIGNYTVTTTAPTYFAPVPLQYSYSFNTYDTLVTGDFALHATATVDSVGIFINPMTSSAKPGFPFRYIIGYGNDGTTTLSPNIVFHFDNTRLNYDSSSNAAVIHSGNTLTLSEPGFVAGSQKNFTAYFTVNPAAVIGDTIPADASIHANAVTATANTVTEITGAFDPNDKWATPVLTPIQVINGDFINYTIRFQNTGNDTAVNIVITDTLNGFLQPASLQVISTSHPCKITVKGNVVYFEFINIMLADIIVNELKSHGYVSFRVKPINSLPLNTTVPNKAAIYFDYNSPVITNTAITTVADLVVVPLKLLSFTVNRAAGLNANLYWQTSNELSVKVYTIELSTNGRTFTSICSENAKGHQYDSYTKTVAIPNNDVLYFRLKIIDMDGNYSYSQVKILKNDHVNASFSFLTNPVKDVLSISLLDESLKNTPATIFNAQSAVVKKVFLQNDVENIDIKSLPAGTYYLVTEKASRQFVVIK